MLKRKKKSTGYNSFLAVEGGKVLSGRQKADFGGKKSLGPLLTDYGHSIILGKQNREGLQVWFLKERDESGKEKTISTHKKKSYYRKEKLGEIGRA